MPEEGAAVHTILPETARRKALENFAWLRPHLEDGVPLAQLARESGIPLRTAQDRLAAYRRSRLKGLVRRPRADQGKRRLPTELQLLIEGLALQDSHPPIASICRKVKGVAAEQGWKEPSYSQVYSIVSHLNPALVMLAQEGTKAYEEAFDLLYRREASRPNEIWQADHTPPDIRVLDERGRPAWAWLTVIMDDYSRAIPGYFFSLEAPSAIQTSLALHQAIWRKADPRWHVCGIPQRFYTDHGSDFTSHHMEQVAVDLKMRLIFSRQGKPRGRGRIERFFRTVKEMFLCDQPGYSPNRREPAEAILTLAELDARFKEWLLGTYHTKVHSETKQQPQTRWEKEDFLPNMPESLEQLDLLLLTVPKQRLVHQDGIRFEGHRYMDLILAAYVDEQVIIRYDPRDLGEIRVYQQKNHQEVFLCRAVCPELAGETISPKDIIRTRNAQRRKLRKEINDRRAVVERFLPTHPPSPASMQTPEPAPSLPQQRLKGYKND